MKPMLEVIVNKTVVMEYDRNVRLPGKQREFLDKMDFDMDQGICFDGKCHVQPDVLQRGKYIAMNLTQAIQTNNRGMINAMCAYLVNRLPSLNQITAEESNGAVTINLRFDEPK
jgi:hypothetical protein